MAYADGRVLHGEGEVGKRDEAIEDGAEGLASTPAVASGRHERLNRASLSQPSTLGPIRLSEGSPPKGLPSLELRRRSPSQGTWTPCENLDLTVSAAYLAIEAYRATTSRCIARKSSVVINTK